MKCIHCGNADMVKGTLEGVSFLPERAEKRLSSTGVYGIVALACVNCGALTDLAVSPDALRKVLKKTH